MEGAKSLSERREEMAKAVLPAILGIIGIAGRDSSSSTRQIAIDEAVAATMTVTRAMLAALDRANAADRSDASYPETDRREKER